MVARRGSSAIATETQQEEEEEEEVLTLDRRTKTTTRMRGNDEPPPSSPLHRTATILEITRWQEDDDEAALSSTLVLAGSNDKEEDDVEPSAATEHHDHQGTVHSYMARREMTKRQERWNAFTMIPSPFYCLFYLLAGKWLSHYSSPEDQEEMMQGTDDNQVQCLDWSWLPNLVTVPPLPVVFVTLAITFHAPFSFVYHYKYAHELPPGFERTNHLSRRLDQAMIHVASALISYSTSGSWDYFLANVFYNADCFRRHFKKKVRPRSNQIRIAISMIFYTLPILVRGHANLFLTCWVVIGVAVWLFVRYPLGGWSHSCFHLVMTLLPPLILNAACQLPSSQDLIRIAMIQCRK